MSNTQVGSVYQQIIADVIESSRVDFEEGGVDESVLEALRKGWQTKLSQLEVAVFPWDPTPDPVPPMPNGPSISSNGVNYQHPGGNQALALQPLQQIGMNSVNSPHIKAEPGLEGSSLSQYSSHIPNLPATTTTAQQRAAAHLHNNYGPRAAASINAIQQGASHGQQGVSTMQQIQMIQMMQQQQQQLQKQQQQQQHQQQQHQQQQQQQQQQQHQQQQQQQKPPIQSGSIQGQNQPDQQNLQQEYQYKQMLAAQNTLNQQTNRQNNSQTDVGSAQSDGANDINQTKRVVRSFNTCNGDTELMCRSEIDKLIRTKIEAIGSAMEGGGLMLPLHQISSHACKLPEKKSTPREKIRARMDGGDDDDDEGKYEELDEDAINSDLDDPDEGLNEDEEEEDGMGHIMLCMYDKVQRVKNKWKCVMKDGVLTVNNKEYVFHKASGEYEW